MHGFCLLLLTRLKVALHLYSNPVLLQEASVLPMLSSTRSVSSQQVLTAEVLTFATGTLASTLPLSAIGLGQYVVDSVALFRLSHKV